MARSSRAPCWAVTIAEPRPPWTWIACRNMRSETTDRRPNEKGRTTSAGKAGTSKPASSAAGARRSARARKSAQQAARAATARSGAKERTRADAFTCA